MNTSSKHLVNNLSSKGILKYASKYFAEIADLMITEGFSMKNFQEKVTVKRMFLQYF